MTPEHAITRKSFLTASALAATAAMLPAPTNSAVADQKQSPAHSLRAKLQSCLGGPLPDPCPLNPILRETQQKDGYRLESLTYEVEPGDRVPAYLLIPDGVTPQSPAPAVAVWHQHNGAYHLGKVEPAGLAGSPMHHTGVALAKEGYVVLCPDALCFGERQNDKLKKGDFERYEFLRYVVAGKSMAWKNILDMRRAVDLLVSRPEVQADRLGCYGHSMGSTHTWLVGPFEPRLKCLVGNCCLPTYAAIERAHLLHCFPNFIPGWRQHGDTPDIAGLIAPRRLHLNLGETDAWTPIEEARQGLETIADYYRAANAENQFTSYVQPNTGHVLSPEMWTKARDCFSQTLRA